MTQDAQVATRCMSASEIEARYERAAHQLEQLTQWRNESLAQLETMCRLPQAVQASSGYVMEFNTEKGARLLDRIALLNVQIERAMEDANRFACQLGRRKVQWQLVPNAPGYRPSY